MKQIQKLFNKNKIKKISDEIDNFLKNVNKENQSILIELERCEKISKLKETKDLIQNWKLEYQELTKTLESVNKITVELDELLDRGKFKRYEKSADELLEILDELLESMQAFYEKIKNYTSYEYDNTKMALNLKERLKDLINIYEQKLKILDVYNESFIESTSKINLEIKDFEEKQILGQYPEARKHLKLGNEILELLELKVEDLILYYENIFKIEDELNVLANIKKEIEKGNYKKFYEKLNKKYKSFTQDRDEIQTSLQEIRIDLDAKKNDYDKISSDLKALILSLTTYIEKTEKEYEEIKIIEENKKENQKSIKLVEDLIAGGLEEKETISKLYQLGEVSQLENIEKEKETFDKFKKDYETLNNYISEETNDFKSLTEKIYQSKKYLARVIVNVKHSIKGLEAIRSDEIQIRQNIESYKKEVIGIDLFLRENKHKFRLNKSLKSILGEITAKIDELVDELEKEPLNITLIRANDNIINKLLKNFISEMGKDLKQRKGVEKLTVYFNRFVVNDETYGYTRRFLNSYNDADYRQVLKEIHQILTENNPKGEVLYKNVVSQVNVGEYNNTLGMEQK